MSPGGHQQDQHPWEPLKKSCQQLRLAMVEEERSHESQMPGSTLRSEHHLSTLAAHWNYLRRLGLISRESNLIGLEGRLDITVLKASLSD